MIIIKLQGGLGNQMFEYAFGRSFAIKYNQTLKLDLSTYTNKGFKGDTPRTFQLDKFNIQATPASDEEVRRFQIISSSRFIKKTVSILARIGVHSFFGYITEKDHRHYDSSIHFVKPVSYYFGWWQSENYFKDSATLLKKDFTLSEKPGLQYEEVAEEIKTAPNSVFLHIRRGDFITNPTSVKDVGFCDIDYYIRAMEYIVKKTEAPHFFVFSDDISWVQVNLVVHYKTTFVSRPGLLDQEELVLMGQCHNAILSNSTFSWWGAWLGDQPKKIVIRPRQWFANPTWSFKDLILDTWIPL